MRASGLFWAGAALTGVLAGGLVLWGIHRYQRTDRVVIATVDIPPWTLVTASDLRYAERPAVGLAPDIVTQASAAVGRFTTTGFVPGQTITTAALSGSGLGSAYDAQLAALDHITEHCTSGSVIPGSQEIQCGQDIALPLSLGSNQGYDLFHRGSRIDLFATMGAPTGEVTQMVASGVYVMARIQPGAAAPIVSTGGQPSASPTSGIAVLAVTPDLAQRILLAGKLGTLTAGLDPIGGGFGAVPSPLTEQGLLGSSPPASAPADAGTLPTMSSEASAS